MSFFPFFASLDSRECRRMQDTTGVNLHLRPFPSATCFLPPNRLALLLPDGAMAGKTVWRQMLPEENTRARKPCPHDNDGRGTSVTAAGKRRFPFVRSTALSIFLWRVAPYFTLSPFSFPPLQMYANVPMPPFQTASGVIFVAGAKVKTGLGTQIF